MYAMEIPFPFPFIRRLVPQINGYWFALESLAQGDSPLGLTCVWLVSIFSAWLSWASVQRYSLVVNACKGLADFFYIGSDNFPMPRSMCNSSKQYWNCIFMQSLLQEIMFIPISSRRVIVKLSTWPNKVHGNSSNVCVKMLRGRWRSKIKLGQLYSKVVLVKMLRCNLCIILCNMPNYIHIVNDDCWQSDSVRPALKGYTVKL